MKRLTLVLALFAFGCNGAPPPPPPPPPEVCEVERAQWPECESTGGTWSEDEAEPACNCECPEGHSFIEGTGCQLDPPPPQAKSCATPTDERERADYIPLNRADHWQAQLRTYDQRLVNNGIRNPAYALRHCGPESDVSVWPYNGVTAAEAGNAIDLSTEAKRALTGADGESGFYARVAEVNRRCPSSPSRPAITVDATDEWCGRSQVYRPCFTEYLALARWLTDGCAEPVDGSLAECERFHLPSQADGVVAKLDGVKGACNALIGE